MAIPQYQVGAPVVLGFSYDGGLGGWDGQVWATDHHGTPCLVEANGCFLVVTRGRQPFEPERLESGGYPAWRFRSALHGRLVSPRTEDSLCGAASNLSLPGPFEAAIDIGQIYAIDEPGIYTVYWGMEHVWSEEIVFQVVPEITTTGIRRVE